MLKTFKDTGLALGFLPVFLPGRYLLDGPVLIEHHVSGLVDRPAPPGAQHPAHLIFSKKNGVLCRSHLLSDISSLSSHSNIKFPA